MLDKTAYFSAKEQILVCIWWVDKSLKVYEPFFGFYQTETTTSEVLFKSLIDVICRFYLSINDLRGQCYDGAANTSGHLSGLHTLVREKESRALYVHCRTHNLNVVAQDSVENQTEIHKR